MEYGSAYCRKPSVGMLRGFLTTLTGVVVATGALTACNNGSITASRTDGAPQAGSSAQLLVAESEGPYADVLVECAQPVFVTDSCAFSKLPLIGQV